MVKLNRSIAKKSGRIFPRLPGRVVRLLLLMMVVYGVAASPTQGASQDTATNKNTGASLAAVVRHDPNAGNREEPAVPLTQALTVINFDQDGFGNDIPDGERIDDEYANLGIHFNGALGVCRRTNCFPTYTKNTSLNFLCGFATSDVDPNCPMPTSGPTWQFVVDLDFPVSTASIEGYTRNDGVFDSDGLKMQAFDENGNLLVENTAICNNNPAPFTIEGVCVPKVSASGIRRLVITPLDFPEALDTLILQVEEAPDLAITKDNGKTTVVPDEILTYELAISNDGNGEATGILVTDTLPANTTFVAASDGGSQAGGLVTWPAFNLPAKTSVTRSVTLQVNNPLPAGVNSITNSATVADDGQNGPDLTPDNNTATDTDIVEAAPDLVITKDDGQEAVQAGQALTYILTICNDGNQEATGILVTDTLPANTTFVAASDGGSQAGGLVTWPAFNLPAGACVTRSVTLQVNNPLPAGVNSITNSATVADDGQNGPDPTPDNNTATDTDPTGLACKLYAVHDKGARDSQLFTIEFTTPQATISALGPEYPRADIEAMDFDPVTGQLFAIKSYRGEQISELYRVDSMSGELFLVGPILNANGEGFREVDALSFHPDGSLWGFAKRGPSSRRGLIQIDPATGAATLVEPSSLVVQGLAWAPDGSILWASLQNRLFSYTPGGPFVAKFTVIELNREIAGLEALPDGRLLTGIRRNADLAIYSLGIGSNRVEVALIGTFDTNFTDLESLAWPQACAVPF